MPQIGSSVDRREIDFRSGGKLCAAWLYAPRDAIEARPCVVMAHGFGATREMSLAPYAERFAAAGMNALLFDYRHFGASEGEPRQVLSVRRQLRDYAAALECARKLDGVDASRVAVWGTSFSGGHALVMAEAQSCNFRSICRSCRGSPALLPKWRSRTPGRRSPPVRTARQSGPNPFP